MGKDKVQACPCGSLCVLPVAGQDLNVSLLEFNAGPDLKMTGARLDYVIAAMLGGMADVVLAPGAFGNRWGSPSSGSAPSGRAATPAAAAAAGGAPAPAHTLPDEVKGPWLERAAVRLQWDRVYHEEWPLAAGSGGGGGAMSFR